MDRGCVVLVKVGNPDWVAVHFSTYTKAGDWVDQHEDDVEIAGSIVPIVSAPEALQQAEHYYATRYGKGKDSA